ncbi:MAG: PrsW family glutamic-type intramembrane protease [Planctomycetota bacterium]
MNIARLALAAIGPALVCLHVIYAADRHAREPLHNVVRYVLLGVGAAALAGFIELEVWAWLGLTACATWGPVMFVITVFLFIAFLEELCKYGLLRAGARNDAAIDEPFDWVVYAVAIALGFAAAENLYHVFCGRNGMQIAALRALTAVPAHAMNGTLMGDRLARAALATGAESRRQRRLAIIEPTIWHGVFDSCAIGARQLDATRPSLAILLAVVLVLSILAQWVVAARRVLLHYRRSPMCLLPPILYPIARRVRAAPHARSRR